MKKTIFLLVAALCSFPAISSSANIFSVNDYIKYHEVASKGVTNSNVQIYKAYLNGVASGFNTSNAFSDVINQKPLFCTPNSLIINGDMLELTLQSYLKGEEGQRVIKNMGDSPLEAAALKAFITIYPCK